MELSSGNMDFEFSDVPDVYSIRIQNGDEGNLKNLDANVTYDGKMLKITDIDSVDVSWFEAGDLRFIIKYGIQPTDGSSLLKATVTKETTEEEIVTLQRAGKTPQWVIRGETDNWGSDCKAAGVASSTIYDYLPDNLGEFKVLKSLKIVEDRAIMEGTIILEQTERPDWISTRPIPLSCLELPTEIIDEMLGEENLILSLFGVYDFEIPLALDQFNIEKNIITNN